MARGSGHSTSASSVNDQGNVGSHGLVGMHLPGSQGTRRFKPNASVVLVGIRGSGKRSLGFVAAAALNRRFITEEHYFKDVTGCTRQEFLQRAGSREFHHREVEVMTMMLDNHRSDCVIECGLGSLTKSVQDHLQHYSQTNPVIYLLRDMERIQTLLNLDDSAVQRLESTDPSHRYCSNFEFYNFEDHSSDVYAQEYTFVPTNLNCAFKLKDVKEDFMRFVCFITGLKVASSSFDSPFSVSGASIETRSYSHAVFIRLSDFLDGSIDINELESGGDAVEYCVDVWPADIARLISRHVSMIRRRTGVPIIFSVDLRTLQTKSLDTFFFPVDEIYFKTLAHGLRLGVEFISLDLTHPHISNSPDATRLLLSKGRSKIIGHSFLEYSDRASWEGDECFAYYRKAELFGCDVVRILGVAKSREDNDSIQSLRSKLKKLRGTHPPLIAYNVGALGRTSQIFNPTLTSVTHPALKRNHEASRCDPQITSKDAVKALFHSYVLDPLQFYVLGASVAYSLSPAMHNAAFKACGMKHVYRISKANSLSELDRLAADPDFGGASVVQPWRVKVFEQVASKSRHAEAIGAVNTVLPLRADATGCIHPLQEQANQRNRAGKVAGWYGVNTDWISIFVCLRRSLSPRNAITLKSTGLVIGAGGMARAAIYAMLNLGCRQIFIFNRTVENAENVANHFNSWTSASSASGQVVRLLRSPEEMWPNGFAFPCMIASCVPANSVGDDPPADFEVPQQWLGNLTGGVILETAYSPLNTLLLKQMRRFRSASGRPWILVDGLEVIAEQGIAQFELLTGRRAPRRLMRLEVLRNYVGEEGQYNEKTIQARLDAITRTGH